MFKKLSMLFLILTIFIAFQSYSFACHKKKVKAIETIETKDTVDTKIDRELAFVPVNETKGNRIWVGTFQLIWNDLVDDIIKAPVEFIDYKSPLAESLNKKGFMTSDISDDSYYKKYGYMTPELKKEIEKNLKEKLNEKSDILDTLDWNPLNFLLYAMLKKDFEYPYEFEILKNKKFMNEDIKAFGLYRDAKYELRRNVRVLFYNGKDDFAVKLITKGNDEVILYSTNNNLTLEENYKILNKKTENYKGDRAFLDEDSLMVPNINFNALYKYDEFKGKRIKNSDFMIDTAIQTVKFKLDNKGGSLKSEAAIVLTTCALPEEKEYRDFIFNKPFILFLKEKDKNVPYFIAEFKNAELFEKN